MIEKKRRKELEDLLKDLRRQQSFVGSMCDNLAKEMYNEDEFVIEQLKYRKVQLGSVRYLTGCGALTASERRELDILTSSQVVSQFIDSI